MNPEAPHHMPVIRSFGVRAPRISSSAWIAPGAVVVGDVEIGDDSSIWYAAVVRGDVHHVRIGARTNIQDGAVVHVTRDRFPTRIGDEVTVGHRAVVHGCDVGDGALIGIGAVVLDGARIGEGALIGAGAVVTPGSRIDANTLALGTPARPVRRLGDEERSGQRERTLSYVGTAREHAQGTDLVGRVSR
jgi:carbonic anhydrase/acetyltransferase-like protein (isoleucine patch superfamily)